MRPAIPIWHSQSQPPAESSRPAPSATDFKGFMPLTANFTQSPNEIVDLKLPGLTSDLRWTLHVLSRETIGVAYLRGGSPYDFWVIPWTRWMELLELRSINAVKSRLARLEELGLIEVQLGERGPWGTTPNRYRLRWANDGQPASRTFHGVLTGRSRQLGRKREARTDGYQRADAPRPPWYQPAATPLEPGSQPGDTPVADIPSSKQTEYPGTPDMNQSVSPSFAAENNKLTDRLKTQSVSPSVLEVNGKNDGLTDRLTAEDSTPGFDWKSWLKDESSEPWPAPLLQGLREFLDSIQMFGIKERSPWSAEGAWAILQAVRAAGRGLGNQAGAIWNGVVRQDKGIRWLAEAGPMLRKEGWQMEPEDGTPAESILRSLGAQRLARRGLNRLPLYGDALERHRSLCVQTLRPRTEPYPFDDDNDQEQEDPMHQHCEEPKAVQSDEPLVERREEPVTRPEELCPEVKAELRTVIEAFREVRRALIQSSAASREGSLDAFSKSWECIVNLLEPVLPLLVKLPDEYRPTAIRQRSQIKMNVVHAVYLAVS